ncbi:hypothetical protein LTR86_006145 [Recurvomyces mirabilis]|nr:hypothetical protein LTR86_006145 [Recurvomyces mirabilis]
MYAPHTWSRWILVPLWTIHIVLILCFFGLQGYFMLSFDGQHGYTPTGWIATISLIGICMLSEPLEIVLRSFKYLQPLTYLGPQICKVLFWSIYLILDFTDFTANSKQPLWMVGLAIAAIITASYYASLAYGAFVTHRWLKGGRFMHVDENGDVPTGRHTGYEKMRDLP